MPSLIRFSRIELLRAIRVASVSDRTSNLKVIRVGLPGRRGPAGPQGAAGAAGANGADGAPGADGADGVAIKGLWDLSTGGGGGATCAYPLDDDGTAAASFGTSPLSMDAPAYQTLTYTTAAGNAVRLALPANVPAALLPRPADTPMAAQYTVTAAELPVRTGEAAATANYGGLMIGVISSLGAVVGTAYVQMFSYDDTTKGLTGIAGFYNLYINDVQESGANFDDTIVGKGCSFYVNPDGSIGHTYGGVDRGVVAGLTVGPTDSVVFALRHNDNTGLASGITFSGALLTSAAEITEPVPDGCTDICGNAIAGAASLPAGAAAGDIFEVSGAGTYGGVTFSIGDLAFVRSNGTSVTRIGPGADGAQGPAGESAVSTSVEETGTARTLSLTDVSKFIRMTSGSANEITVPANADVPIPVDSEVHGWQEGAGVTSITGAAGVIINGQEAATFDLSDRYKAFTLKKLATNTWALIGALA